MQELPSTRRMKEQGLEWTATIFSRCTHQKESTLQASTTAIYQSRAKKFTLRSETSKDHSITRSMTKMGLKNANTHLLRRTTSISMITQIQSPLRLKETLNTSASARIHSQETSSTQECSLSHQMAKESSSWLKNRSTNSSSTHSTVKTFFQPAESNTLTTLN